jgi:hypothetical protein
VHGKCVVGFHALFISILDIFETYGYGKNKEI